ncbi:MAG: hypothetical protein HFG29_05175 [Eubacterium sp.]|nr:hypothetical protein [Eubacterium sp.]
MKVVNKVLAIVISFVMVLTIMPAFSKESSVNAAEEFIIVSPKDNELKGAGHFDITWSDVQSGNLKNYQLYIDGVFVTTTNDTTYDYYTTDVKMYEVYVRAEFLDGSFQNTPAVKFGVTKKGLCVNNDMGKKLNPRAMNMGWYYDWGTSKLPYTPYKYIEFVPMIWGNGGEGNIPPIASEGYRYLLAYNEPDMGGDVGGSNITVDTAVANWPKFTQYDSYYLGAPAPALSPSWGTGTDGGYWFRSFMEQINHDTIDFIPLHCYYGQYGGAAGAQAFLTEVVDKTYEMYHKPIWVTEFAVSGWGYDTEWARKSVEEFISTAIRGLNERPYVERYSWFSFDTTDNNNGASALWTNATGELTDLGKVYVNEGNPEGYVASTDDDLGYTYSESRRESLLDDTVTIDSTNYEDYVNQQGVTVSASSGESSAKNVIDNDIKSRWESEHGKDPQNLTIDLGQIRDIKKVDIIWEAASAKRYTVEVSENGENYTVVADIEGGSGTQNRLDEIVFRKMIKGRYIKIHGISRNTTYGYSIYDMAVYGTQQWVSKEDGLNIQGFQINTTYEGSRVVGFVEPVIEGKKVVNWGFVYGLDAVKNDKTGITNEDLYIREDHEYIKAYESTSKGTLQGKYGQSETATYFARTLSFGKKNVTAFTSRYKVRVYALMEDGTYLYSDVAEYTVYDVADQLYQNSQFMTLTSHNYAYNTILKLVNPNYQELEYGWESSLVKP